MDVGSGSGVVEVDKFAPFSYPDTIYYDSGSVATLEAIPDFGYVFDGWSGDVSGTTNPVILLMDCDKNINASFSINWLLVGGGTGGVVLVIVVISVLIFKIRRRATAG